MGIMLKITSFFENSRFKFRNKVARLNDVIYMHGIQYLVSELSIYAK